MNLRATCAVLLLATLVAGCDSKTPKAAAPEAPVAVGNLREDAALLASRGDYAAAERKYREALKAQPDDVELHFGLGSVLSQLDRREEAAEEFRWVVKHGKLGRPEVDSARRWLAEAGDGSTAPTTAAQAPADTAAMGTVSGKLTWPGLPPDKEFGIRVFVFRDGDEGSRKSVRTKLNGTFSVGELPEGAYKINGLAGPVRIWSDVPVTVTRGRETSIDLSPANAIVSATDFPARIR